MDFQQLNKTKREWKTGIWSTHIYEHEKIGKMNVHKMNVHTHTHTFSLSHTHTTLTINNTELQQEWSYSKRYLQEHL